MLPIHFHWKVENAVASCAKSCPLLIAAVQLDVATAALLPPAGASS